MKSLIHIQNLCKHFQILNRHEGLSGAFRDLFSADYRTDEVTSLIYFSPIIGIGLFAITYWIWTQGVNSYTGTGS